jgi:hypothetical protein
MNISQKFDLVDDHYGKFEDVENKFSLRNDLHAFILLDKVIPKEGKLISAAEHDEYYLDYEDEDLEMLTDANILDLVRCSVRYSDEFDCLAVFP